MVPLLIEKTLRVLLIGFLVAGVVTASGCGSFNAEPGDLGALFLVNQSLNSSSFSGTGTQTFPSTDTDTSTATSTDTITSTETSTDTSTSTATSTDTGTGTAIVTGGVSITESGSATLVTEGSGSDSYSIVLDSAPTANVIVQIAFDTQITVNGNTTSPLNVTFTPSNWDTAQSIVVKAVDDTIAESPHPVSTITHTTSSADASYEGLTVSSVNVTITDNDSSGVGILLTGGSTSITEGGATDSYQVYLTSAPSANVTVNIVFNGARLNVQGSTSSPQSLTFTTANYYVPQTVNVVAVDDGIQQGTITLSITHSVSSADGTFNGLAAPSVTVLIVDNDSPAVALTESAGDTSVLEGGATDTIDVVLTTLPAASVQVSVAFDPNQLRVNGSATSPVVLSFTTGNWSNPQQITISAYDDSNIEGSHASSLTFSVSSADTDYNGFPVSSVAVSITDNDISPLISTGVQTGEIDMSAAPAGATKTVTITTVDRSKAFVICTNRVGGSATNNVASCQLTADDTITVQTGGGTSSVVRWYVAEFTNGAAVQRGSKSIVAGSTTASIALGSAVDLSKAFVVVTSRAALGTTTQDEQRIVKAWLQDSSTLQLKRGESGVAVDVEWQVIELDGANVQSGLKTITAGNTEVTAPLSPFDSNSALLFFSTSADTNSDGIESEFMTHGIIDSSSSVKFKRYSSNNSVEIAYFVVELQNGTSVQRGSVDEGSTTTSSFDYTIPVAVNVNYSIPFVSAWSVQNTTSTSDQDTSYYTVEIPDTTTIRMKRSSAEDRFTAFEWYVMSLTSSP